MKRGFFVALATAVVFAAGFFSRVWMERHQPMPPPPVPFGAEFVHRPSPGFSDVFRHDHPLDRADLVKHVRALRPQLEAFRTKMEAITLQFDKDMDTILTPEQRAKRAERLKQIRAGRAEEEASKLPLSDQRVTFMLRDQPAQTIMGDIVIPLRLDWLTRIYKLDDEQREKVRDLLKVRREKVLELVDSSPPPSVMLSRLAPMIQRLSQDNAPPPSPTTK